MKEWNNFVSNTVHISFLFYREYVEYHSDRFNDFSFLLFENAEIIGICAANRINEQLISHEGLTYGGILFDADIKPETKIKAYKAVRTFLTSHNIDSLKIKALPSFYTQNIEVLDLTTLKDLNFKPYRTDPVFAIDYSEPLTIHKTKLKHYRKNESRDFQISESEDFSTFWNSVLIPRLLNKHQTKPVHTLEEIHLLKSRFPNHIKQYNIALDDEILAGITIFDKGPVVKSQYGATTDKGEKMRALEYLFLYLIYKYQQEGRSFFSMGTVRDVRFEDEINPGLKRQKEELGCKEFQQHFYTFDFI